MNILFYFPTNKSSVSLETLMEEFTKKGHQIFLLGWEEKGVIHETVEKFGVKTATNTISKNPSYLFYLKQILFLRKHILKNKIDMVYSHTQPVNFIAVFSQFIVSAKFYICRHHSDYIMKEGNKNAMLFDRIINTLGRDFIVPSKKVFNQLTLVEGVKPKNVRLINYAYNFDNYPVPNLKEVERISANTPGKMNITAVSRFIPCKRYDLLIESVSNLVQKGFELHLNILGEGPLLQQAKAQVLQLNMSSHITFVGYTTQVLDYMAAANLIVHFSDSEASNSVIKEAGLIQKMVAVCNDVGDFDDYIQNEVHGFMLDKADPSKSFEDLIPKIYENTENWKFLGANLKDSVMRNFSVENVINQYTEIT